MKHLSRDEMKKVMGGNAPQTGCYLHCCFLQEDPCQWGHLAIFPIDSCEGAGNSTCMGGFFVKCNCWTGPTA
ncbi:MAG: hypothetical protein ABI685_06565 [Ferruginibacter sp.]